MPLSASCNEQYCRVEGSDDVFNGRRVGERVRHRFITIAINIEFDEYRRSLTQHRAVGVESKSFDDADFLESLDAI